MSGIIMHRAALGDGEVCQTVTFQFSNGWTGELSMVGQAEEPASTLDARAYPTAGVAGMEDAPPAESPEQLLAWLIGVSARPSLEPRLPLVA